MPSRAQEILIICARKAMKKCAFARKPVDDNGKKAHANWSPEIIDHLPVPEKPRCRSTLASKVS